MDASRSGSGSRLVDARIRALRGMRVGLVLALVGMFGGFLLGGVFGGLEHQSHNVLLQRAQANLQTVYHGDEQAMLAAEKTAWTFWKRAHLHASAMGTSAAVMIAFMVLARGPRMHAKLASLGMGLGSVGYPGFLIGAGWLAPVIGNAAETKEAMAWLAIPSAGAFLMGTAIGCWTLGRVLFGPEAEIASVDEAREARRLVAVQPVRPVRVLAMPVVSKR